MNKTQQKINHTSQQSPKYILQKYFGYSEFREGQLKIIQNILQKKDCLAILPTGGGKSICFQIPGIIFTGITIVISPLISLMKDQVDTLNSKGISACYISSLLTFEQLDATYELLQLNRYKFVYIAPERLASQKFQRVLSQLQISLLVIDEAHCISSWGDFFRPAYKQIISNIKMTLPNIACCPVVAFTATAHKIVQTDICETLQLQNPFIFYKSFARNNLSIEVIHCSNQTIKNLVLLRLLQKHINEVGIIYCATRKITEQLTHFLQNFGFDATYYHGGLENKQKQIVQLAFTNRHTKIIVATNAFGMGIDVHDIRFVIHYQIPGSIENYYQEIGRAGRDQKQSWCYTFYCPTDETIQYELLKKFPAKIKDFEKIKRLVVLDRCRNIQILEYFGEKSDPCNLCDICKRIHYKSQLMIHASQTELTQIKTILELRNKNLALNRQFPLTDIIIAFLVILKPKTELEFLKIPGIGLGFIQAWHTQIQQVFY
ncbi:ATP-dependent DNA helicase RecQ [Candidatus Woesebacteria bacterium]|nr:ATP-dependent DNA helicase RecQ [Candidatus Woesebacteria bacterium]